MCEAACEEEEDPDKEENSDAARVYLVRPFAVAVKTNREVPADEREDGHKLLTIRWSDTNAPIKYIQDVVRDGLNLTEFQVISTTILASMNANQAYDLEGRSRASYSVRCSQNTAYTCWQTWEKMVKKRKTPNIWFCMPRVELSVFRIDRPIVSA